MTGAEDPIIQFLVPFQEKLGYVKYIELVIWNPIH